MEVGREKLKLQETSLIISSILDEMRENTSVDSIKVICKDRKSLSISSLLLASISPYLSDIMKTAEVQECMIFLPDIELSSIKYILDNALSNSHPSLEADKEKIQLLDGVFWSRSHQNFYSTVKKDEELLNIDEHLDVKHELSEDEVEEEDDNIEEDNDGDYSGAEDNQSEEYFDSKEDVKDSMIPDDESNSNSTAVKNLRVSGKRKGVKKRKLDVYDSDLEDKVKVKKKRGRPGRKPKVEGKLQSKIKEPKKIVDPSQITDEKFLAAQENLQKDLEDCNNLEDPKYLWFQYHGLNSQIYLLKTHDKVLQMICPVCWVKFTRDRSGGKHYFAHLRQHKYKQFQCQCNLQNNKDKRPEHIQQFHWKWKKCDQCRIQFEPDLLRFHIINRHPEHAKPLQCHICSYSSKKIRFFKQHMDNHFRGPASCGCYITFSSKRHKEYHLQAVHLREKVVCDKPACFFICDTEEKLSEHRHIKHPKKEEETPPQRFVCDLCGQVYKCVSTLKTHEKSVHDTVMLECPHCAIKLNKYSLQRHLKRAHQGLSVCNVCGAKVKQLKNHMAMHVQPDQMKFKCEYCPKGFMLKYKLERHVMSVHLKDRSYPCRYGCDSSYNSSNSRNEHEKRQHGQLATENKIK